MLKVKELIKCLREHDPDSRVRVFIPEIMYEDSAGDVFTTVSHIVPQDSGAVEIYYYPKEVVEDFKMEELPTRHQVLLQLLQNATRENG